MTIIDTKKLPRNIGFKGLKRVIQNTLPDDTPCPYCNVIMERNDIKHPSYISIDHVIPYSRCQTHSVDNLMAACKACNSIKSNRDSFNTFTISHPQKLSSDEVAAIHYLMRNEWKIMILEEIRVLILNKDFASIQLYTKDLEFRLGSSRLHKLIQRILHIVSRPNDKSLMRILCDEYKIDQSIIKPRVLVETIIDFEVENTRNRIQKSKIITKNIQYKEIIVNVRDHFKKKKVA